MMTKQEKLELATIVAEAVVKAMKATTETPSSAKKGRKSATANEGNVGQFRTDRSVEFYLNGCQEQPKKSRGSNEGKQTKTKYSMSLADYEPKMKDGFYIWGKKTDTIKSKHYMAMQKAYCYAMATKGRAITSDECYNLGIEVDYEEGSVYAKAKANFKKKYVYIRKADR